jgi:hypothetical protein
VADEGVAFTYRCGCDGAGRIIYQGEIDGKRSGMTQNLNRAARRRWPGVLSLATTSGVEYTGAEAWRNQIFCRAAVCEKAVPGARPAPRSPENVFADFLLTLQRLRRRNVQPRCAADALPFGSRIDPCQQVAIEAHVDYGLLRLPCC